MDFSPVVTVGNIITTLSILISVTTLVITVRAKLDYLSEDLKRLFNRLEEMNKLVQSHDKELAIIKATMEKSPKLLDKVTSMMLTFERRLDDIHKRSKNGD
jgi:hypothetical protein